MASPASIKTASSDPGRQGQPVSLGILPASEIDRIHEEMRCQFEAKCGVIHEETVRISKSGVPIPVLLTRVPLKNEKGQTIALLAILKDISEERKLKQKVEKLQRNTAMAKVAGKVAHEIRTPLGVLFLKSDLLVERLRMLFEVHEHDQDGTAKHQSFVEKCVADIQKQISRLEEIANNYLHLSRSRIMERENVNINALLKDISLELIEQYHDDEITLEFNVADHLPVVRLDQQKFQRVIANLFRNSIEAIRASHIENAWVRLVVEQERNHLVFQVIDNGPGMPEQIKQKAFDPFTTTKSIGTGLGLYLVCEIVENHGGTISIDSAPSQGTTIRIVLPLNEETQSGE